MTYTEFDNLMTRIDFAISDCKQQGLIFLYELLIDTRKHILDLQAQATAGAKMYCIFADLCTLCHRRATGCDCANEQSRGCSYELPRYAVKECPYFEPKEENTNA